MQETLRKIGDRTRDWLVIALICAAVFSIAFVARPHGPSYGPAPYFYNPDLHLWLSLADHPIASLPDHVLANRPLFAYLGWVFAQPIRWVVGDRAVGNPKKSGGVAVVRVATAAGLLLANFFCFLVVSLLLYEETRAVFNARVPALIAAALWAVSSFAFAWSYHPTNQIAGLVVIFAFCLGLSRLESRQDLTSHALFGVGIGVLLLMKGYFVLPFLYVLWGIIRRWRLDALGTGFVLFFFPTLLWRRIYVVITHRPFVDYHFGEEGAFRFIGEKLATADGFRATLADFAAGLADLLAVAWKPIGLFAGCLALIFFARRSYRLRFPAFHLFAWIYVPLLSLFLILSGRCSQPGGECFFIPRHGSDFFPLFFPAAGIVAYDLWRSFGARGRALFVAGAVVFTAVSYSQSWLRAADFL